ncbi:TPA: hypothetical protein KRG75_000068 [Clostridioides difficile]|nr:condensation domain-containing protein [Peptoniphilus harei]HBG8283005.1 hypothetical protein [Clostridioides difficile]
MDNYQSIVDELLGLGIELYLEDDKLKYKSLRGKPSLDEIQKISKHKEGIKEYLRNVEEHIKNKEQPFPLSPIQSAYLIGRSDIYQYGGVSCHIYQEIEYSRLNKDRVEKIWNLLIKKHGMLRAVIFQSGFQQILEKVSDYNIIVGSRDYIRNSLECKQYELGSWPMFDIGLSSDGNNSVLHISIDFIISDWSGIMQLLSEFEDYYFNKALEEYSEEKYTFRNYRIDEIKNALRVDSKKSQLFWQRKLNKIYESPILPTKSDYYLKKHELNRFKRLHFMLSKTQWNSIRKISQNVGVTPTATIMAAYAVTLKKYSINKNMTINMTNFSKTNYNEYTKKLIGDFTNTLLISIKDNMKDGFINYTRNLNNILFEALDNKSYSGVDVIRDLSNMKHKEILMPYVFTSAIGLPKIDFIGKFDYGISQSPQVFIDCQCSEFGDGLQINWDIREGVFDVRLIEEMFYDFKSLVVKLSQNTENWHKDEKALVNYNTRLTKYDILGLDGNYCPRLCVGKIERHDNTFDEFTGKYGWENFSGEIICSDSIDEKSLYYSYILSEIETYLLSLDEVFNVKIDFENRNLKKPKIAIYLKVRFMSLKSIIYKNKFMDNKWLLVSSDCNPIKYDFYNVELGKLNDAKNLSTEERNYVLENSNFIPKDFLDFIDRYFELQYIVGYHMENVEFISNDLLEKLEEVKLNEKNINYISESDVELTKKIQELLSEVIDVTNIDSEEDLYSLGVNSLIITKISTQLIEKFNLKLRFEQVLRKLLMSPSISTIREIVLNEDNYTNEGMKDHSKLDKMITVKSFKENENKCNSKIRVVLHGAFGGTRLLDKLIDELVSQGQGDVYLMAVSDVNKFLRIDSKILVRELAKEFFEEISKIKFREIQIIGYSFSGNVALELGSMLLENGIAVENLSIIEGSSFPDIDICSIITDLNFLNAFGITLQDFGIQQSTVIQDMRNQGVNDFSIQSIIDCLEKPNDKKIISDLNSKSEEERLNIYSNMLDKSKNSYIPHELFKEAFLTFKKSYEAQHYMPNIYFGDIDYYITTNHEGAFGDFEELLKIWDSILVGKVNKKYIEGNHYSIIQDDKQVLELANMLTIK